MALSRHLVATPIGAFSAVPLLLFVSPTPPRNGADVTARAARPAPVSLIIRTDDIGMSHSVNLALQPRFNEAVKARQIELMTYRQLVVKEGLKSMRRPAG